MRANQLYNAYRAWCMDNGMKEQSPHKFGRYLTAKGFRQEGTKPVKRLGLRLLEDNADHTDLSDLISEKSPIEKISYDFLEKGREGRKGRKEDPPAPWVAAAAPAEPTPEPPPNPLETRILAVITGTPSGFTSEEIFRQIGNDKGTSIAMIDAALLRLVMAGKAGKTNNGRWTAQ